MTKKKAKKINKKTNQKIKIQFGSGANIKPGFINTDLDKSLGADVICDLEKPPYPFPDNYADYILCEMALEHIRTPTKAIEEFHRIIKPEGTVRIIVPHFSHAYSLFADVHVARYNIGYFWGKEYRGKEVDMWNNVLKDQHWGFFDKDKKWRDAKVELIFPKGYMTLFSLPFQLLFGKNKILQGIYEHLFSTYYRACEIHVTYKNKFVRKK